MGIVYLTLDLALNRYVALKKLVLDSSVSPETADKKIRLFVQEARAAARLSHPNIISVYEVFEHNNEYYIAMEYVNGTTLLDCYNSGYIFDLDNALKVIQQVALALDYAHSRGVIHRDVKPSNIMIDSAGKVKIMDFGVARIISRKQGLSYSMAGSRGYMSPEQVKGGEIGGSSDIFSLGVIFYQLLTGYFPFDMSSMEIYSKQVLSYNPPSVRQYNPAIPYEIEKIINKCLEKQVSKRYENPGQIAGDIQTYWIHQFNKRNGKSGKRKKIIFANISLVILLVFTLIIIFLMPYLNTEKTVTGGGGPTNEAVKKPDETVESDKDKWNSIDGKMVELNRYNLSLSYFSDELNRILLNAKIYSTDNSILSGNPVLLAVLQSNRGGALEILLLEKKMGKYTVTGNYIPQKICKLSGVPRTVNLNKNKTPQIILDLVDRDSPNKGFTIIADSSGGNWKFMSGDSVSNYPLIVKDLDNDRIFELLASNLVGWDSGATDMVIVKEIYRFDEGFKNVSADYPEYYTDHINQLKHQVSGSHDQGYIEKRIKGIIWDMRLMGSPDSRLTPEETIRRFYQQISDKNYLEAYLLLGEAWHRWQNYTQFLERNSKYSLKSYITGLKEKGSGNNFSTIDADIIYRFANGMESHRDSITYNLVREDGIWKIDRGISKNREKEIEKTTKRKKESGTETAKDSQPQRRERELKQNESDIIIAPPPLAGNSSVNTSEEIKSTAGNFFESIRSGNYVKAWVLLSYESRYYILEEVAKKNNMEIKDTSGKMREGGNFARENFWNDFLRENPPGMFEEQNNLTFQTNDETCGKVMIADSQGNNPKEIIIRYQDRKNDKGFKVCWIESTRPVDHTIQIASFKDEWRAEKTVKECGDLGIRSKILRKKSWYTVVSEDFPDYESARKAVDKFKNTAHRPFVRIVDRGGS